MDEPHIFSNRYKVIAVRVKIASSVHYNAEESLLSEAADFLLQPLLRMDS